MAKNELLVIDPQVDFCDPNKGSLCVAGADKDMERLALMIDRVGKGISRIHVTMDCHHFVDVAHPVFWRNSQGENPAPFTIITATDVKNGVWVPALAQYTQRMIEYTETLEKGKRYPLCIWPPHCLIGTEGNNIYPVLAEALLKWEERLRIVNYVTKGSNFLTEHYSAVKSEVPDPNDPTTQLDTRKGGLIDTLMQADLVGLAGEAGSHCLANTVRDIANGFNDDSYIKKLVLLEDATSPVTNFEKFQDDFVKEMTARGMQVSTTAEFLS
jgi:nicotinamidase-related amidase